MPGLLTGMVPLGMLHHLSASSPAFLGLVAVLVVVLIALVKMLWGPPWWKGKRPRK